MPAQSVFFLPNFNPLGNFPLGASRMSVLIINPTKEGFIVGADGRASLDGGGKISDEHQKIFVGRNNLNHFVCSIVGLTAFRPTGLKMPWMKKYDFVESLTDGIAQLATTRFDSDSDYVHVLSSRVRDEIATAKRNDTSYALPSKYQYARGDFHVSEIFVVGYWDGKPFARYSTLTHRNQIMSDEIEITDMMKGSFVGMPFVPHAQSHLLGMALYANEKPLLKYRPGLTYPFEDTLTGACTFACTYLEMCCDEATKDLDPGLNRVGGHIHIAAVTPDGCEWIRKPKQLL